MSPEDTNELELEPSTPEHNESVSEGFDSFPDPDLAVEQPEPSGEVPPTGEVGDPIPPAGSQPPTVIDPIIPPAPTFPPNDGGFTPYTPPRTPPPAPQQTRVFSVAQLQQGVDDGTITSNQMIEQLQVQNREEASVAAIKAVREETRNKDITRQLDEFRQAIPGWDQPGSQANAKASPAYTRLLGMGLPETDTTRLLALEQTFGSMNRIRDAQTTRTRTAATRDTVQEVGRRGPPPSSRAKKDPLDILSMEEKKLYKDLIDKGSYSGWKEVREEVFSAATQTSNTGLREAHAGLL